MRISVSSRRAFRSRALTTLHAPFSPRKRHHRRLLHVRYRRNGRHPRSDGLGRRVPEDVGVIGFDGIEMSKFFVPRITTIEQPIDEIARESVRVLMDMLENGRPPRHIVVPAKVQMRESV